MRHWPLHFKRFKLQYKAKRNLDSRKRTKKSASDSLRDIFIQCMYTHIHPRTHTHRFAITFGAYVQKNSLKVLNFNKSEEKTQKVLIVASFEGDD